MSASIIIGNYNYARFLGAAIDSALAQTHADVEVIVVDDGSTDHSREVIAAYGDRITAVLKENGGMASTYNAGFPLSRGEVVLFLDSDDMLLPTAVEGALAALRATPGASKAHWQLWETDGSGQRTGGVVPQGALRAGDFRSQVIADGPDAYLSPPTSGNAWTRAFLQMALPMPESPFRRHADVYLATLAGAFGPVAGVKQPQGLYRVHGANDYAGRTIAEKTARNIEIYQHRCDALAGYLGRRGVVFQPERWRAPGSPFDWMRRLDRALADLASVVPVGATFILVDEEQWGEKRDGFAVLPGRRALPFTAHEGVYNGPPASDTDAVEACERLRSAGAYAIAFADSAFWWLDHYTGWQAWLDRACFPLVLSPALKVYAFTAPTTRKAESPHEQSWAQDL